MWPLSTDGPTTAGTYPLKVLLQPPYQPVELVQVAVADGHQAALALARGCQPPDPSCAVSRRDSSATFGSSLRPERARALGRLASSRTSASVSRTLRPRSTTIRASASAPGLPISARAWPADSWPVLEQLLDRRAARSAAAACWRHGCGSCRSPRASASWVWRELVDQPAVGLGLLQRRQVGALQVLDQRQLERLLVGELAHDDRHLVQARPAAPPASAARRRRSRSPPHRRPPGGPGAAAGRRARGSTAPAPRARPRRSGGAAAGATGAGTRSAPAAPPARGLSRRRSRRRRPAGPTGPCRARGVRWALPPALMPRPAGARGAASRRRDGRRPGRPRCLKS